MTPEQEHRLLSFLETYMTDHDKKDPPVCDCSLCRHAGALLVEVEWETKR